MGLIGSPSSIKHQLAQSRNRETLIMVPVGVDLSSAASRVWVTLVNLGSDASAEIATSTSTAQPDVKSAHQVYGTVPSETISVTDADPNHFDDSFEVKATLSQTNTSAVLQLEAGTRWIRIQGVTAGCRVDVVSGLNLQPL